MCKNSMFVFSSLSVQIWAWIYDLTDHPTESEQRDGDGELKYIFYHAQEAIDFRRRNRVEYS